MCMAIITPEIQPLTEKKGDNKNGKTIQTSKTNANANLSSTPWMGMTIWQNVNTWGLDFPK